MLKVFIWPFRGKDVAWGHASLQIDGGKPDGTVYISWWPDSNRRPSWIHDKIYCATALDNQTFLSDVLGEKAKPSQTIVLDGATNTRAGLNETAIKAWWGSLRKNGFTDWCTLGPNCSTVVAYALLKGGADRFSGIWTEAKTVWTPASVAYYAKDIANGIKNANTKPRKPTDTMMDGGLPLGGI